MNEIVKKIYKEYTFFPRDVQTNPMQKNATPRWFHVSNIGNEIVISKAVGHSPSSKITRNRTLDIVNAEKMVDLYLRRKKGMRVADDGLEAWNKSYWFGILKDLGY